jgi:hypothetical protein
MAGLAVLRGFAHARLPLAESTVAHLLAIGVPGLAVAAVAGGMIVEPFRSRFLAEAFGAALVFIVASILALAIARLTAIGRDAGFDWRRNPAWLGLAIVLLAVAILTALPLAAVAGRAIELVLAVALGPLLVVGLTVGLKRTARRVIALIVIGGGLVWVFVRIFGNPGEPVESPPPGPSGPVEPSAADQVLTLSLGGLLLLLVAGTILILAALWLRRAQPPAEDLVEETRSIDRGTDGPGRGPRRAWRVGRRREPAGAAEAYVALLGDLERRPDLRRTIAETPARHAARLREAGRSGLALDLLAADYALARYGELPLSAREDGRGVARWRRLRRALLRSRGGREPSG